MHNFTINLVRHWLSSLADDCLTITPETKREMDPSWSETGDRYLFKLFRDYLFHQVSDTGAPWIDLSHVVQTLGQSLITP